MWSLRCVIHGHTDVLKFEKRRIYARCVECLRETNGWALDRPADAERRERGRAPANTLRAAADPGVG